MTIVEIVLCIAVVILIIWNIHQHLDILDLEHQNTFYTDSVENKLQRHIGPVKRRANAANGDVQILAEKLGLYFDTIPRQSSKRVLRKRENDEIVDQELDFNFEIDKEEE